MSTGIKLIFNGSDVDADILSFNVENSDREIDFKVTVDKNIVVRLKSSSCPEWDEQNPYVLFLQGSLTEHDNLTVNISKQYLKYILFAIYNYNNSVGIIYNSWVDRFKFTCNHCKKDFVVQSFDTDYFSYCKDCLNELHICDNCGSLDGEYKFGRKYFCKNCVNTHSFCQVCEKDDKTTKSSTIKVPDNYHGADVYIEKCSTCFNKSVKMKPEYHYHFTPEQYWFYDYNFKTKCLNKYTDPVNNKLFMGTEIESQFDFKRNLNIVLGKILQIYNKEFGDFIYAKHDGTIPDPGSEIVTHPMTLNTYRSIDWKPLFDNIIKPTSTGIGGHIHINKNAFISPLHVYKFCKFLKTNVQYVEWIGERSLQQEWCKNQSKNGKMVHIAKQFKNNRNSDRYELINFTANTIELRFFWSPSTNQMLLKNVEFVDALYNFSKDCRMHFTYQEFEDWIDKHSFKYPYLYNFIYSRFLKDNIIFKINKEMYHDNANKESVFAYCDSCDEPIYNGSEYDREGVCYFHVDCAPNTSASEAELYCDEVETD